MKNHYSCGRDILEAKGRQLFGLLRLVRKDAKGLAKRSGEAVGIYRLRPGAEPELIEYCGPMCAAKDADRKERLAAPNLAKQFGYPPLEKP